MVYNTEEDIQWIKRDLWTMQSFWIHYQPRIIYSPPTGHAYVEPNIMVEGKRFRVVDSFVYMCKHT